MYSILKISKLFNNRNIYFIKIQNGSFVIGFESLRIFLYFHITNIKYIE